MAGKENSPEGKTLCPDCGKQIAQTSRAGSLTSYLFQPFNCTCATAGAGARPSTARAPGLQNVAGLGMSGSNFCPDCGLGKVVDGPGGSITGFLFQATRCKCQVKTPSADSEMAKRFWKLKQAGAGNTFSSDSIMGQNEDTGARASIDLLPGAVIGNQYRIVKLIGRGGMGEVYLAQHLTLDKTCALKLIPPDQLTDNGWKRFQNEAKSIAGLEHVNLVKVSDLGIHEGCLPYYAMEYIDGQTLAEMLETHGPMPLKTVLEVFMQICDGVDYAHRQGVVHRDLKPANIMLVASQAGKFSVKILDFGLVKLIQNDRDQQSLTSVGDVFGSPFYMSPEQCIGGKIDNRSDIYSLGCTMFETLTGRPPFSGESPVEIVTRHQTEDPPSLDSVVGPKVFPEAMEVVLAKLLRKNPVERYQTLLELRGDLEKVARGEEVQPFYVRRTTQFQAGAEKIKVGRSRTDFGAEAVNNLRSLPTTIAAIIFLMVAAGILVFGGHGFWQSGRTVKEAQQVQKHRPKLGNPTVTSYTERMMFNDQTIQLEAELPSNLLPRNQIMTAALLVKTPFSRIVTEDSKKYRCFDFPKDVVIGILRCKATETPIKAFGQLKYPEDEEIYFTPSEIVGRCPDCLKRFQAGDLYSVRFDPKACTDQIFRATANLRGIRKLDFYNCRGLTPASVATLSSFHHLKALEAGNSSLDGAVLAKAKCWESIEDLHLLSTNNVLPILQELKNARMLRKIGLGRCKLTLQDFQALAALSQLTNLDIGGMTITNHDLTVLSTLHNLTGFILRNTHLDSAAVGMLKNFRSLTYLDLSRNQIGNDQLASLISLNNLTELDVQETGLDDSAIDILKKFKALKILHIRSKQWKPGTMRKIKEALPGVEVR